MNLLQTYFIETWALIAEMGPYLLLGFLVSGALRRWIREAWIEKRLGSKGLKSITLASLFGVPMPLCSCGVIPVAASLRARGASKGAAASFLTSTPQTGVDSIIATYGMLGPVFAVYRVAVAFISGLSVGWMVERFGSQSATSDPEPSQEQEARPSWSDSLRYGFYTLPKDISASLLIGFLLAGLISALAPDDILGGLPGGVYTSILLTTLIAIPFYICSTGSIPLALALIDSGLPISAALVLLIAGPATNVATITTMRKTLGGRETMVYVASLIAFSWVAALVFHNFLDTSVFELGHFHGETLSIWKHLSGILLVALLGFAYLSSFKGRDKSVDANLVDSAETATFKVSGMTCSHCLKSVTDSLNSHSFVNHADVDLRSGQARIGGSEIDRDAIVAKLDSLGYGASDFSVQKNH